MLLHSLSRSPCFVSPIVPQYQPLSPRRIYIKMNRFDRVRKALKENRSASDLGDSEMLTPTYATEDTTAPPTTAAPCINLPIDAGLDMHQFDRLFGSTPALDRRNGNGHGRGHHSIAVSSPGSYFCDSMSSVGLPCKKKENAYSATASSY